MKLDFKKTNGLLPVIIQDYHTLKVLMLGYMNEIAYEKTKTEGLVTFYSRSRNVLWMKGESSGNVLKVKEITTDCDQDTLLIQVIPQGPVCHTGRQSCFSAQTSVKGFLYELEQTIHQRITEDRFGSYTNELYKKGINKIAQKVGEEAVELVIEAKDDHEDLFNNEAADLLYHFLILLKAKNSNLEVIENVLKDRA